MKELTKKFVVNRINCPAIVAQAIKEGRYVYVGRPSKWGNPFVVGRDGTRTEVIAAYRKHLLSEPELVKALPELEGKVLGCNCLPLPCHAEVLAELANAAVPPVCIADKAKWAKSNFIEQVASTCKCGKPFHVGHVDNEPVILHGMPHCKDFERLDLVDFLRWNRGATEN